MKYAMPVAVVLLCVSSAHAQEWDGSGAYTGASLSQLRYKERDGDFSISDTASAYRLLGGYRFNQHFAMEGSWGSSSGIKQSYDDSFLGTPFDLKGKFETYTLRAVGMLPLRSVGLFGGVGYYDSDTKWTASAPGLGSESFKIGDDGATLIGGMQFDMNRFRLRLEYEWFDTDSNIDASTLGFGMMFRF
jgi:OmpA-OmpF porin, OOP family